MLDLIDLFTKICTQITTDMLYCTIINNILVMK